MSSPLLLRFVVAALALVALLATLASAGGDKGSITVTESKTPGPSATVAIQKPEGLPQIQFVGFDKPSKPQRPSWLTEVVDALRPDSPPALVQNIESVIKGGVNAEKPQKPTLSVSATPSGTPAPIVIEAPQKVKGNVSITKTTVVDPPSPPAAVNVTSPAFALNVTVLKEPKQSTKPFYQGAQANISVTKFSKQKQTNYSYANPASNFSITLSKPGSSSWARDAQTGQWTKQKSTQGLTVNGSIAPPVASGPLDEIVGKRLVCKFPAGSSQQQLADAVEVPAALANAVAASGPYSFIAPPFGLKVFGPGCQVFDWACRSMFQVRKERQRGFSFPSFFFFFSLLQLTRFPSFLFLPFSLSPFSSSSSSSSTPHHGQVPCSGHGVCLSTVPSVCKCFSGYASCLAPGSSTGCETNTFSDPNNCGGCGRNLTTGEPVPQFVCPAVTPVCCGRLGCQTQAACSAAIKTNSTTQQTSTFPSKPSNEGAAAAAALGFGLGGDGVDSVRGDAPSRVAPAVGDDDGDEWLGGEGGSARGGGRSAAARPSFSSFQQRPSAKNLRDAVENLLPVSVMPGEEVSIPAVPEGMNAAQANAALASASAREGAALRARNAAVAARGMGGGLAGAAGASDQGEDEFSRRTAAAAGRVDEIGGGRGVGTSAVFSG